MIMMSAMIVVAMSDTHSFVSLLEPSVPFQLFLLARPHSVVVVVVAKI